MRTTTPATIQRHVLPGETGGDTAWFRRQNGFEQQETFRQVAFKRSRWPHLPDGQSSQHPTYTYPHILPAGQERLAFYEPLAGAILSYLDENDIALHSEVLNLKSSQAACLNFLFPLRQDLDLARSVLRPVLPGLREVTGIEFEYTGPPGAMGWLGELEHTLDVVRAECVAGNGYPYAIETADAVAVITLQDRERFYRVFQEFAEKEGLPLRFSQEVVSKRNRRG